MEIHKSQFCENWIDASTLATEKQKMSQTQINIVLIVNTF